MTTTLTAVTLLTLAIYCHSTPLPATTPETSGPDYSPDSYLGYQPVLPLGLQLPREDNPGPFYAAEPPLYLSAPREDQEPNYYQVPIPAQDLEAPTETQWNPSNNPKFYYEVPALLSKQELPTEQHPKKYNEEVHSKKKPYSSKPKQELVLEPIDKNRYDTKQRALEKTFEKLAKKQNQKEVEAIKVKSELREPIASGSGFVDSVPAPTYDQGLSGHITASLGIPHSPELGERLDFHVAGHDGPHSYKFGFDTGKGHDRMFRFEERDKTGQVKGHYGFYDKEGKLKVVHYDAHPEHGFHSNAEGNES